METLKKETTLNILMYLGGIFFLASIILLKVFYFKDLSIIAQAGSLLMGLTLSGLIIYKTHRSSETVSLYVLGFAASLILAWYLIHFINQQYVHSQTDITTPIIFAILSIAYTLISSTTTWATPFIIGLGSAVVNFFSLYFLFFSHKRFSSSQEIAADLTTYLTQRPSIFLALYLIIVSQLFFVYQKKDRTSTHINNPITVFMGMLLGVILLNFFALSNETLSSLVNLLFFLITLVMLLLSLAPENKSLKKPALSLSQTLTLTGIALLYFLVLLPLKTLTPFLILDLVLLSSLLIFFSYTNKIAFIGTTIVSSLYFIPRFLYYLDTAAQWVLPTALMSLALIIFSIAYKLYKTKTM